MKYIKTYKLFESKSTDFTKNEINQVENYFLDLSDDGWIEENKISRLIYINNTGNISVEQDTEYPYQILSIVIEKDKEHPFTSRLRQIELIKKPIEKLIQDDYIIFYWVASELYLCIMKKTPITISILKRRAKEGRKNIETYINL